MRGAEGPRPVDRTPGQEVAQQTPDLRHVESLGQLERRQDSWEAAREHGLAGAGRAAQEEVVSARCRDLDRASRLFLAMDLSEVVLETVGARFERDIGERLRGDLRAATQVGNDFSKLPARDYLQASDERRLVGIDGGRE